MPGSRPPMKTLPLLVALLCLGFSSLAVADEPVASELRWKLSEDFRGEANRQIPMSIAMASPHGISCERPG